MEIEAKFIIRHPRQFEQVLATLAAMGYAIAESHSTIHTDTYFETEDRSIMRAGWAYRFRQCAGSGTLTLKSFGEQQGVLFIREEIEQTLPDQLIPRDHAIPAGPLRDKLLSIIGSDRLDELFSIRTRRAVMAIVAPGETDSRIELDLDHCLIQAKKARKRAPGQLEFTELEIESGDAKAVTRLALNLYEKTSLVYSQFSKFGRGLYAAGISEPDSVRRKQKQRLKGKDPVLDLIFRHLRRQLVELREYQPVAREGIDPEGVHKMRVALRRMRAVLKTFKKILAADIDKHLERELRWLTRQLGQARDADVCEMQVRSDDPSSLAEAPNTVPYRDHLQQVTIDSYRNLADVFESQRYTNLVATLEHIIATGPSRKTKKKFGDLCISDCADRYVGAKVCGLVKRGDKVTSSSDEKHLHKLRLAAKRLRYVLDFFSTAQKKQFRKKTAALQELQDLLGEHQDAVMARDRHKAYIDSMSTESDGSDLQSSIEQLSEKDQKHIARCRRRFPKAWSQFKKAAKKK